jgi:HAD superfamily hydrolase (TIGR01450 family)
VEPRVCATLADVADRYDGFVLDAFGVLNVGATPIPGAVERMAELRGLGKALVVLTNAASVTRAEALEKYRRLGFDFAPEEVVSSRDLAATALAARRDVGLWAAITGPGGRFGDIEAEVEALDADESLLERADGFLFLGSEGWTPARQAALIAALRARPRPLVVANPDVVAPREAGFSLEPGHFAHEIGAATGIALEFHGKPFPGAFAEALRRMPAGVRPERVAMVGDTLHTDVLGGRAAGLGAVLVASHGLFKGRELGPFMARSGIWPDAVVETT